MILNALGTFYLVLSPGGFGVGLEQLGLKDLAEIFHLDSIHLHQPLIGLSANWREIAR